MRFRVLMVSALVAVAACKAVTSPDNGGGGGGPAGDVIVGNTFYKSAHNGSQNPAVDTIAAGDSVTWVWNAAGSHMIQSTGTASTIFRNSIVLSAATSKYTVTFKNPGTYPYQCGVHGAAMTGVIVVQ
jgi:plastocyanin